MKLFKILFFLTGLLLSPVVISMDQASRQDLEIKELGISIRLNGDGYAFMPKELLLPTLTSLLDNKSPWQTIRFIHQLCKVCKNWYFVIITNPKAIREMLTIKPLCWAAALGQADRIIELKLIHGFSLREPDEMGLLPCHFAIGNAQLDCMKILLVGGALRTRYNDIEKLKGFVPMGDEKILAFIQGNAPVSYGDNWEEYEQAKKELIQFMNDKDYDKVLSFLIIQQSHYQFDLPCLECIKDGELVGSKIDLLVLYHEQAGYEKALFDGYRDLANSNTVFIEDFFVKFEKFHANPNVLDDNGKSPLYNTSQKPGFLSVFKRLLSCNNIDPEIHSRHKVGSQVFNKWTPAHSAAWHGTDMCLEELLKVKKCDPNIADSNGHTPLHYAALKGKIDCITLLLENGAIVNAVRDDYSTSLHCASLNGHIECAKLLINAGAWINSQDRDLNTPLHLAASRGHLNLVKLLCSLGADTTLKNTQKATALDYAKEENKVDVFEFLNSLNF